MLRRLPHLAVLALAASLSAAAPSTSLPVADTAPPPAQTPERPSQPPTAPPATPSTPGAPTTPPASDAAAKKYPDLVAVIETNKGTIKANLAVNAVPKLVAHFANLADRKFYDGLKFHAVSRNVQIHSGDPTGTGDGDCGYRLPNQYHKSVLFDKPGILGLWTTSDRSSSQFFITLMPMARKYNLRESGIGVVTQGLDVAALIEVDDIVKSVRVEGDQTLLRQDFASDLAIWNATLDRRAKEEGGKEEGAKEPSAR